MGLTAISDRQMGASQYNEETFTRGTGTDSVGYPEIIQSHDANESSEDTTDVKDTVDTAAPERCCGATLLTLLCYSQALTDTTLPTVYGNLEGLYTRRIRILPMSLDD